MARASRHAVWAISVMAMAVAGCGSSAPSQRVDGGPSGDAMLSLDIIPSGDTAPDLPVTDGGPDDTMVQPCFVPTDCSGGLTCCLVFASAASGFVRCQPSCVGDGVTTFVVCATDTDCPTASPACTQIGTNSQGQPLDICSQTALPPPP